MNDEMLLLIAGLCCAPSSFEKCCHVIFFQLTRLLFDWPVRKKRQSNGICSTVPHSPTHPVGQRGDLSEWGTPLANFDPIH